MRRRAIIISNPSEKGAENYCAGVLKDVEHYRTFLGSAIGGYWKDSEIQEMNRPLADAVRVKMALCSIYDYVLIIFTGHGWHSTDLDSTVLELCAGQQIDSNELRLDDPGQTIILDCCRERHRGIPEVKTLTEMLAKAARRFDPDECRKYYDKPIEECGDALVVVMCACSVGEKAGDDDQKGGYYSYNLLTASKEWAEASTLQAESDILSVVTAHREVERRLEGISGRRQTPHIEKPRTGPYHPFCVIA